MNLTSTNSLLVAFFIVLTAYETRFGATIHEGSSSIIGIFFQFLSALVSVLLRLFALWATLFRYPRFIKHVVFGKILYALFNCEEIRSCKITECDTRFNKVVLELHSRGEQKRVRLLLAAVTGTIVVLKLPLNLRESCQLSFLPESFGGVIGYYTAASFVWDLVGGWMRLVSSLKTAIDHPERGDRVGGGSVSQGYPSVMNSSLPTHLIFHKQLKERLSKDYAQLPLELPRQWIIFDGQICGAFFVTGLFDWLHENFETPVSHCSTESANAVASDPDQWLMGFAGASSGSHLAGYAGAAVHYSPTPNKFYDRPSDSQKFWALDQMTFPFKFAGLLPLGMLFSTGEGVREAGMRSWRVKNAIAREFQYGHSANTFTNKCVRLEHALSNGSYLSGIVHPLIRFFWPSGSWFPRVKLSFKRSVHASHMKDFVAAGVKADLGVPKVQDFATNSPDPEFSRPDELYFGDVCANTAYLPFITPSLAGAWAETPQSSNWEWLGPGMDGFLFLVPPTLVRRQRWFQWINEFFFETEVIKEDASEPREDARSKGANFSPGFPDGRISSPNLEDVRICPGKRFVIGYRSGPFSDSEAAEKFTWKVRHLDEEGMERESEIRSSDALTIRYDKRNDKRRTPSSKDSKDPSEPDLAKLAEEPGVESNKDEFAVYLNLDHWWKYTAPHSHFFHFCWWFGPDNAKEGTQDYCARIFAEGRCVAAEHAEELEAVVNTVFGWTRKTQKEASANLNAH